MLAHADKVLLNGAIGQSLLPGLGMAISLAKLAHACHEHKVAHEKFQSTAAEYRDVHARYDEAQTIGKIIDEDSEKLAELMGRLIPLQASKKAIHDTIEKHHTLPQILVGLKITHEAQQQKLEREIQDHKEHAKEIRQQLKGNEIVLSDLRRKHHSVTSEISQKSAIKTQLESVVNEKKQEITKDKQGFEKKVAILSTKLTDLQNLKGLLEQQNELQQKIDRNKTGSRGFFKSMRQAWRGDNRDKLDKYEAEQVELNAIIQKAETEILGTINVDADEALSKVDNAIAQTSGEMASLRTFIADGIQALQNLEDPKLNEQWAALQDIDQSLASLHQSQQQLEQEIEYLQEQNQQLVTEADHHDKSTTSKEEQLTTLEIIYNKEHTALTQELEQLPAIESLKNQMDAIQREIEELEPETQVIEQHISHLQQQYNSLHVHVADVDKASTKLQGDIQEARDAGREKRKAMTDTVVSISAFIGAVTGFVAAGIAASASMGATLFFWRRKADHLHGKQNDLAIKLTSRFNDLCQSNPLKSALFKEGIDLTSNLQTQSSLSKYIIDKIQDSPTKAEKIINALIEIEQLAVNNQDINEGLQELKTAIQSNRSFFSKILGIESEGSKLVKSLEKTASSIIDNLASRQDDILCDRDDVYAAPSAFTSL